MSEYKKVKIKLSPKDPKVISESVTADTLSDGMYTKDLSYDYSNFARNLTQIPAYDAKCGYSNPYGEKMFYSTPQVAIERKFIIDVPFDQVGKIMEHFRDREDMFFLLMGGSDWSSIPHVRGKVSITGQTLGSVNSSSEWFAPSPSKMLILMREILQYSGYNVVVSFLFNHSHANSSILTRAVERIGTHYLLAETVMKENADDENMIQHLLFTLKI
jgi:hypothetical protein